MEATGPGRVRDASRRRKLRGSGARRRRDRVDRDATRETPEGRPAVRTRLRRGCPDCRRRLGHRGEVRLRVGCRYRTEDAAGRPADRCTASGAGEDLVSGRACRADRIQGPQRGLHCAMSAFPRWNALQPRAWSMRWTGFASGSPFPSGDRAGSSRARQLGCRSSCMPSSSAIPAGPAWRPAYGALVGRSCGICHRRGRGGTWLHRAVSRCFFPGAFYTLHETQLPPIGRFARTGCRWRWPPIATRAPRRWPRFC